MRVSNRRAVLKFHVTKLALCAISTTSYFKCFRRCLQVEFWYVQMSCPSTHNKCLQSFYRHTLKCLHDSNNSYIDNSNSPSFVSDYTVYRMRINGNLNWNPTSTGILICKSTMQTSYQRRLLPLSPSRPWHAHSACNDVNYLRLVLARGSHFMSPAEAFATGIKIESSDQCSFKGLIRRGIMVNNHPTSRGRSRYC